MQCKISAICALMLAAGLVTSAQSSKQPTGFTQIKGYGYFLFSRQWDEVAEESRDDNGELKPGWSLQDDGSLRQVSVDAGPFIRVKTPAVLMLWPHSSRLGCCALTWLGANQTPGYNYADADLLFETTRKDLLHRYDKTLRMNDDRKTDNLVLRDAAGNMINLVREGWDVRLAYYSAGMVDEMLMQDQSQRQDYLNKL